MKYAHTKWLEYQISFGIAIRVIVQVNEPYGPIVTDVQMNYCQLTKKKSQLVSENMLRLSLVFTTNLKN